MLGRVVATVAVVAWMLGSSAAATAEEAAPATAVGTISGVVLDKATGEPVIDAGVEVVELKRSTRTDVDGKYVLKVPPGTYQVRVFGAGYQGVRLQSVVVSEGQVAKTDATLAAATGQAKGLVVEVTAQANKATEATQLLKRQKAAVVEDTISAEAIKTTPGSQASDVVKRAPAVTVRSDKFIYVRGLGERYSSALLNGSRLPSTDPEKRAVPLDLFPAGFLDAISITKTYTPDLPGDFSGGLANLELRDFPDAFAASLSLGVGGNTEATAQTFNTDGLNKYDWFAFGETQRQLPRRIPALGFYNFMTANGPNGFLPVNEARAFPDNWGLETICAPPNAQGSFAVGDSIGPFGFQLAGIYNNEWQHHRNEINRIFTNSGGEQGVLHLSDNYRGDRSIFISRVGSIFTSALKLGENSKLTFRTLWDHNGYNETLLNDGRSESTGLDILNQQTRFRYTEESLAYGQLGGEHHLPWMDVAWRSAFSRVTQDEPDTRFLVYQSAPGETPHFTEDSLSGQRLYNQNQDYLTDSALDFTVPFTTALPYTDVWSGLAAKLKFGAAYSYNHRDFQQRRFKYTEQGQEFFDPTLPPQDLLQPSHIGPGGFEVTEATVPRDQFRARQEVAGGYVMTDLPLVRDMLRLIAGVRVEYSYILLRTFDDQGNYEEPHKNNLDPLPGVNLVYSPRKDMNVRAAFSQSVSRPEFRELSPAFYPSPRGLYGQIGNPNLVEAKINSYDLRWEWFFSPLELVSAGVFYKTFDGPIEPFLIQTSGNPAKSWTNAKDADLVGFELEARKDLSFFWPTYLRGLSLQTNVTGSDSNVNIPSQSHPNQTLSRPLAGQSPYLINTSIEYVHERWGTFRLLYNIAGRTLYAIGLEQLPNIFEEPRNQLDAVWLLPLQPLLGIPMTTQLTVQNLLNDPVVYTQGAFVSQQWTNGVKFTFNMTYQF